MLSNTTPDYPPDIYNSTLPFEPSGEEDTKKRILDLFSKSEKKKETITDLSKLLIAKKLGYENVSYTLIEQMTSVFKTNISEYNQLKRVVEEAANECVDDINKKYIEETYFKSKEYFAISAQTVAETLAKFMSKLNTMESIYVRDKDLGFECWIIANYSTREDRFRLYDIEYQMMELAPGLDFKFNLIDRQGHKLHDILTIQSINGKANIIHNNENA